MGTSAISGGINAGFAGLTGGNVAQSFGRGLTEGPAIAGLNQLSAPFINQVLNRTTTLPISSKLVLRAPILGGVNIAEDYLDSFSRGQKYTANEALLSGAVGAIASPLARTDNLRGRQGAMKKNIGQGLFDKIKSKFDTPEKIAKVESKSFKTVNDLRQEIGLSRTEFSNASAGALAGLEVTKDEEGNYKFKFNPTKAGLGIAFVGGVQSTKGRQLINEAVSRGSVVAKEAQDLSRQFQQNTQTLKQLNRTLADSTTEIGKDFRNVINRTDITPDVKVNILDYMRTPDRVLKKIGLGSEAELLKTKYRDYLKELPQEINKVTEWSKRAPDSQKIFQALDGREVPLNANEKAVVGEIRQYLSEWADKLGLPEDKRIANYITHIFEDDFIQKEFDPAIARLIQDKVPGSVYDPFLQKRLGALGYKEDAYQALDAYVKRGTRKFHMDQALGPLKKAAEQLDVESEKYVKRLADRVNLRPTEVDNLIDNFIKSSPVGYKLGQRPTANITRKLRQAVYRGTLGLNAGSALRNLTQGVNTYAKLGEKYTIKGYIDILSKGTKELEEVGALADNIIQDRTPSATKKLWENIDKGLFAFFEGVEKLNRGAAYYGAKAKALNKGASEEEAIKQAIKTVEDTQFTFGSVDTPVALQSDLVKALTQFQSFNVKQSEFIGEMIKNKELGGLLRFAGANALVLASVGKLIGLEPKDIIPFSDVLTGESRIGQTPPIQAGSAALKSVFGDEDTRREGRKDLQRTIPAFIPGGVQTRKTIEGLGAFSEGASFTASGKKRFDIEQTPSNALRSGILGQYSTPEGRDYIRNIGKPQSEILYNELKQLSPEEANKRYAQIKKENPSLASQIKKKVTLDKLEATSRERKLAGITYVDGRVREMIKDLNKLETREEKNALIKRYKDLGIATDAVILELKRLKKEGKI